MPTRYDRRRVLTTANELYEKTLEERNVSSIRYYSTPQMSYPPVEEIKNLTRVRHIWKTGDRFFKLAIEYYNSAQYWWVIAMFNQKPTEADLTVGDLIYIPLPLQDILRYYDK
ncbi:MAG TPA: hypothetical protein DCM40_25530 [Maribacter sp.]|nr:hypothetical protein [Maribacter sp.]